MKYSALFKPFAPLFILSIIFTTGCEDPAKLERYKDPPWLGGSNIETLQEWTENSDGVADSSYAIFLRLMELAEYNEPIEKGLFTLFVPSDKSFQEYFAKIGIDSVGELNEEQAQELFTLHFLRNPLSRYYLVYEYMFEEVQDDEGEYGPLFFRNLTRSQPARYYDSVVYNTEYKGQKLRIYGESRYIGLYSSELMSAFSGAPDGSDYEFFCRDTKWSKCGLNWHNAEITKAEIPTSSGFIYKLDRVIEPPPNIDVYLRNNKDKYSIFYDLMQRFAYYQLEFDENNIAQYLKYYAVIPDLADEFGPNKNTPFNRKDEFTAFVPTDDVLQEYIDNVLLNTYESIDSIPEVTLVYLIQGHITNNLQLASKMRRTFFNSFGDQVEMNPDVDITDAFLASNGVVYSMNKVLEPNAFSLVPGPLFFDKEFSTFLLILHASGYLPTLSQSDVPVTLFAPTNSKMDEYGIRIDWDALEIQIRKSNKWYPIKEEDLKLFITDHIIFDKVDDLSGSGFQRMASGNYIYYNNNSLVSGGNAEKNETTEISTSISKENGILYKLDNVLKTPKRTIAEYMMNDPELSDFYSLLQEKEMITVYVDPESFDTIHYVSFVRGIEGITAFLPTNSALAANPITAETDTAAFIRYHFIQNHIIFDDGKVSGDFKTMSILPQTDDGAPIEYARLSIDNQPNSLKITDLSNQQVTVSHNDANTISQLSVIHKINTRFKLQ